MRAALVWLHRWVGLGLAAVLIIEGITGSLLVFKTPIDRWLNPGLYAAAPHPAGAAPLSLGEIGMRAEAALGPQYRVGYFYASTTGQVSVRVSPRNNPATGQPYPGNIGWLVLNGWTGAVDAKLPFNRYDGNLLHDVMPFVDDLHTSLALGDRGGTILGVAALIWTIDCFTGFYLSLPTSFANFPRRWRLAWRIKWPAAPFRLNFDLHRAGGLWCWGLLFIFAWSSVELTLSQVYEPVTSFLFPYQTEDQLIASLPHFDPNQRPKLDWIQAQQAGDRLIAQIAGQKGFVSQGADSIAYFPENGLYSYDVRTNRRFPHFRSIGIYFDANSGKLLQVLDPEDTPRGNLITNWLYGLHLVKDPVDYLPYQIVVFLFGLVLAGLSGTGVYIWWKKRRARVRSQRTHAIPSDPARIGTSPR